MTRKFGFPRQEKLKSVVRIERLFTDGRSFWMYPFSVRLLVTEADEPGCRLLVSVGKHYFKHAVDRNRVKRLVREAYRLSKSTLLEMVKQAGVSIDVGLVYRTKEILSYAEVEAAMRLVVDRVGEIASKSSAAV